MPNLLKSVSLRRHQAMKKSENRLCKKQLAFSPVHKNISDF